MAENYKKLVEEIATDFVEEYKQELTEIIKENKDKTSDYIFDEAIYQKWDLNDKIHEWIDTAWYGILRDDAFNGFNTEFLTCAFIIEQSENTETDTGLWESQEPQEAIMTQAFFSLRNDVYFEVEKKIKELIQDINLDY